MTEISHILDLKEMLALLPMKKKYKKNQKFIKLVKNKLFFFDFNFLNIYGIFSISPINLLVQSQNVTFNV